WARATVSAALSDTGMPATSADRPAGAAPYPLAGLAPLPLPPPFAAGARSPALRECDRLGANPTDRDHRGAGVACERLDAAAVLVACDAALGAWPGDRLATYQRGRALDRLGRIEEAEAAYRAAGALGSGAALRRLAQLLIPDGAAWREG